MHEKNLSSDASAETHKRAEADSPILPGSPKKQRVGDDQPVTPKDDLMDAAGERAPKTPRLEDYPHQQRMLQVTSTDLDLYEHEDSPVKFDFNNDDVDRMEKYELEFYDDQVFHEDDPSSMGDAEMAKIMEQLAFPHSAKEPKSQSSAMTSFCGLMHWQTNLNFKVWNVCKSYKALMLCQPIQRC
jgi:hypothetical protein